ncbi:MAG: hypothetical protein HG447_005540 [Prevotella sp.]|nr:hypothetical protein [Prevotella sp.]
MNTSYIYHALGLKGYECTKTDYKGNELFTIFANVRIKSVAVIAILAV